MVLFLPFQALHPDPERVDLAGFISEPYDVISPDEYERQKQNLTHNVMRLDIPSFVRGEDLQKAILAALHDFREWSRAGLFCRYPESAFYWYRQNYRDERGNLNQLSGLIGLIRLTSQGYTDILPHETIHTKQVESRILYYQTVGLQTTPVLLLDYSTIPEALQQDIQSFISQYPPYLYAERNLYQNEAFWPIHNDELIRSIQYHYQNVNTLVIGDGHHRYEALRQLSQLHPDNPSFRYVLSFIANVHSTEILSLGYHRLLRFNRPFDISQLLTCLNTWFVVEASWSLDDQDRLSREYTMAQAGPRLIILEKFSGKGYRLHLREEAYSQISDPHDTLDTYLFDRMVLELCLKQTLQFKTEDYQIEYHPFLNHCIRQLYAGDVDLVALLDPVPIKTIMSIVHKGKSLPPKSTYFYPKLPAGLIMYPMDLSDQFLQPCGKLPTREPEPSG